MNDHLIVGIIEADLQHQEKDTLSHSLTHRDSKHLLMPPFLGNPRIWENSFRAACLLNTLAERA